MAKNSGYGMKAAEARMPKKADTMRKKSSAPDSAKPQEQFSTSAVNMRKTSSAPDSGKPKENM